MKHTSGKWKVRHNRSNSAIVLEDNSQVSIATTGNWLYEEHEEMRANAERIVKCVNGWDELENIKESLENDKFTIIDEFDSLQEEATKLREALQDLVNWIDIKEPNERKGFAYNQAKEALK